MNLPRTSTRDAGGRDRLWRIWKARNIVASDRAPLTAPAATVRERIRLRLPEAQREQFDGICEWEDELLTFCTDMATRADRMRDALERIAAQQRKTLGWLQENGVVFDGPLGADPTNFEHVAFSIYTDLCEVDLWARQALEEDE